MKVSREQAVANRERVVDVAARLFRERGFDGIGVADLMKAAGLTHGGFYGQFGSKEELMAEASERALAQTLAYWDRLAATHPEGPWPAMAAAYLSDLHRASPGEGCLFAALGSDVARQGEVVRSVATRGLARIIERFTEWLPGRSKAARRDKALVALASLVGAQVLARSSSDPQLAQDILAAVAAALQVAPNLEPSA
ncbi:TetR/AcrR family transcriptional regulator [Chitinolyticbacter albus]|uniref:TetR/AcrR family transcriptional regulator n=1 Tax=Chitinolyticbacter albus TaxID=2961951 RepID=UPI00210A295C|nr:TetR/AcrR family transcriptional regulator [Chitinolyticbacter albus]